MRRSNQERSVPFVVSWAQALAYAKAYCWDFIPAYMWETKFVRFSQSKLAEGLRFLNPFTCLVLLNLFSLCSHEEVTSGRPVGLLWQSSTRLLLQGWRDFRRWNLNSQDKTTVFCWLKPLPNNSNYNYSRSNGKSINLFHSYFWRKSNLIWVSIIIKQSTCQGAPPQKIATRCASRREGGH